MAVPTIMPCVVVSSGGTSMVICGESPPLKDLAISAQPGGGICLGVTGLSGGVFAHWLEMVEAFAIMEMVSFEHCILWVTEKEPQGWALLHLLQCHSCMVSGSAGLEG